MVNNSYSSVLQSGRKCKSNHACRPQVVVKRREFATLEMVKYSHGGQSIGLRRSSRLISLSLSLSLSLPAELIGK